MARYTASSHSFDTTRKSAGVEEWETGAWHRFVMAAEAPGRCPEED